MRYKARQQKDAPNQNEIKIFFLFQSELARQSIELFGEGLEFLGPILILIGVTAGPLIGALLGTLGGALSVVVGQGLQEFARTEPPVVVIPTQAPTVATTTTTVATVNQVSPECKKYFESI